MVIWLIGISGSGKSTLGNLLNSKLSKSNLKSYIIDGDEVRNFFNNDLGYSTDERKINIKRIIYAANVLSECGIFTIVCNISPFEDLRIFCKNKLKNYTQIYLKKDLSSSIKNDVKKIYQKHIGKTDLVGMEVQFDEPEFSDLVIEVDKLSVEESFDQIIDLVRKRGIEL